MTQKGVFFEERTVRFLLRQCTSRRKRLRLFEWGQTHAGAHWRIAHAHR